MAGYPHPLVSHPWLPARALSCHPHLLRLLQLPPPPLDTRLSSVGPTQRAGVVAMGPSASLPTARVNCAKPIATPSTKRNSATSSTSRAAAPTALDATSSTTLPRTWLSLASPMCSDKASASQACPQAAEPRHHLQASLALPCPLAPSRLPAPHHRLGTFHFPLLPSLLPLGPLCLEETLPQPVVPPAEGLLPLAPSGGPWVVWLGAHLHTLWDPTLMITPAAAAAWVGQTRLSLRPGCLGLLSPLHLQGVFPSSIASLSLSDKCLPSVDQLDLKEEGGNCSLLWGPGGTPLSPSSWTFQVALTHSPGAGLGQVPSLQIQCLGGSVPRVPEM